ncbi:SRPBCC domain-containing protein [Streptomyces sp. NBC_00091]|uniref:SRPBCC domain-containing protein n=1 Tax=Streptomyces sp. NBC_00091 TaxID=2975648 RepID=UPI00224D2780|nr:SRPBCC domain-containing protein [Streptomyces sp. NBC_00091]MCX5377449.1 SRPBCC domain-containing protein [Streptomyces sp. NBC_00091]
MEHQVFVPVPADDLRAVLRDPARVARCVPGLQQDADTASGPLAGRLKVRVGGHTVTYRGSLSLTERDPDHFAAAGEGTEARGSGTVTLALGLRLIPHEGGTRLEFSGGATADGRAAGFDPQATATAAGRLLDRLAANLAGAPGPGPEHRAEPGEEPGPVTDPVAEAEEAEAKAQAEAGTGEADPGPDITEVSASVFDTEVPPPSLDPFLEGDFAAFADLGDLGRTGEDAEASGPPRPPAEAAHARRTMIGRSAEEVDHAPPRGRYAPVPAPSTGSGGNGLRWIAPAAALALASAVVVGRALRRRH